MTTSDLRNTVKEYIEQELSLSEEQYKMIDKRREAHLKGESESFTWEQVKSNARNARLFCV